MINLAPRRPRGLVDFVGRSPGWDQVLPRFPPCLAAAWEGCAFLPQESKHAKLIAIVAYRYEQI